MHSADTKIKEVLLVDPDVPDDPFNNPGGM